MRGKKQTKSQNQMKPFNHAMNQRNANEHMLAYQISKDKKEGKYTSVGKDLRRQTSQCYGGNVKWCGFGGAVFQ